MNHNPFTCPQCHSDNVSSFEMIYNGGTATGNYSGLSYNANIGITGTGGKTHSQSLLAQQCAPPRLQNNGCALVAIGCLIFGGAAFLSGLFFSSIERAIAGTTSSITPLFSFAIGVAAVIVYGVYMSRKSSEQRLAWQEQVEQWRKAWMCLKCGYRWYMENRRQF